MKRQNIDEIEMPFLDHLEELRWRAIRILIAVMALTIGCFFVSDYILDFLLFSTKGLQFEIN